MLKISSNEDQLLNYLAELKQKHDIDEFLKQLFDRLLQNLINSGEDEGDHMEVLMVKFVSKLNFKTKNEDELLLFNYMIQTLFYLMANLNEESSNPSNKTKNIINELLKVFERKYPLKFDSILKTLFDGTKLSNELKLKLQSTINFYTLSFKTAFKYNYLNDHDANLTVCLQHTNDHIRASSLDYIYKYYEPSSNTDIDYDFVKST